MLKISVPLFLSLAGICIVNFIKIPGGTLLGAIVGGIIAKAIYSSSSPSPKIVQSISRLLLGLTIGVSVNKQTLQVIASSFIPISLMIIGLIGVCLLSSWTISKVYGMDFTTSLCGISPGAASAMVVLAEDLGGESPIVAMLHLFRMGLILILMPAVMGILQNSGSSAASLYTPLTQGVPEYIVKLLILVAAGLLAAFLLRRLKFPSAEMMAGVFAAAILNPLFLNVAKFPSLCQIFSIWIIGANIGMQMNRDSLKSIKKYAAASFCLTMALIAMGFFLGWLVYQSTSLDLLTCFLGACPGAMDAMVLLASDMNADVPLVACMHTIRQILVMLLMPFLIRKLVTAKTRAPG